MNTVIISDASVLLTALFGTNDRVATKFDRLLHDKTSTVHILPLTVIEFANGVRFSTRDISVAKQTLERFTGLPLPVIELALADIHAITDLSYRLETTVYDTAYHYAAIMHDGVFITCDRGYFKKSSPLGHIELWG